MGMMIIHVEAIIIHHEPHPGSTEIYRATNTSKKAHDPPEEESEGEVDGDKDGLQEGFNEGEREGFDEGDREGDTVGLEVGPALPIDIDADVPVTRSVALCPTDMTLSVTPLETAMRYSSTPKFLARNSF